MVRVFLTVLCLSALLGPPSTPAAFETSGMVHSQRAASVRHTPPVDAPIIDPFRLPEAPWLPGNRGIEYDTFAGQVVRATAGGTVSFAGQVGGDLFVTVQHDARLRTTVGYVTQVLVGAGDVVRAGEPIAVAGESLHFTARLDGRYIDPTTLFGTLRVVVRLVPSGRLE